MESIQDELNGLKDKISQYGSEDVYNLDETGLFYRMMTLRVLTTAERPEFKNDKDRITICLWCDSSVTNRFKFFVIGKFNNLRSLE